MAFILEDGSGVINANSYATAQEYKNYFRDRGTVVALASGVINAALVKATDYIDTRFARSLRGVRRFETLTSRSILTLTALPLDGETITVGSVVYTFRATPVVDTDVEIGANLYLTLISLGVSLRTAENSDLLGVMLSGVTGMVIYTAQDGVATTETLTNGSFDNPASVGFSPNPQALEFPRLQLFDLENNNQIDGIPPNLKTATILYANRALSAELLPDPVVSTTGQTVVEDVTKVGPIELSQRFSEQLGRQVLKPYPAADLLMADFTRSNGGVVRA